MKKLMLTAALSVMALASAGAQSVAGEWEGEMSTPGGARPWKAVIVQTGEKVTGTVKRPSGDVPLEGTVKGSTLKFSYMINYNGGAVAMEVTSTVTGNDMKGSVEIGSGQATMDFAAKRVTGTPSAPQKPETH